MNKVRRRLGEYITKPGVSLLLRIGVSPNQLSILGFLGNLAAATVIALGHPLWGGVLFLIFSLCDLWDGALARLSNRTSTFGAILDSVLDRLSEVAIFFGLLILILSGKVYFAFALPILFLALTGSLLTSYLRARGEGAGIVCTTGILTRPERTVLLGLGLIFSSWLHIALSLIALLSWVTVVQRILELWRQSSPWI